MSIIDAILLGIVQGITEFIPVSSSAHLTIVGNFLNLIDSKNPKEWTAIIAILQLGTIIAVIIYFYKILFKITKSFCIENFLNKKKIRLQSLESKLGWYIILGSLPIVVFGILLKEIVEGSLTKNIFFISFNLIFFAIVLFVAEKISKQKRNLNEINFFDAIGIGFAQIFALFPGASRSGVTISAGLFSGLKREVAAEFSFLISIPAIVGSGIFELKTAFQEIQTIGIEIIIGTFVSTVVGYFAIYFLLHFLKKHSNKVFIYYRIAFGIFLILFFIN